MATHVTKRRKVQGIFVQGSNLEASEYGSGHILNHPIGGKSTGIGDSSESSEGCEKIGEPDACSTTGGVDSGTKSGAEGVMDALNMTQDFSSSLQTHLKCVEGLEANWSKDSWKRCYAAQDPLKTADEYTLAKICDRLSQLPPLVSLSEVYRLQRGLALVGQKRAFLLHGGECAERFAECTATHISASLRTLTHMKIILQDALKVPVLTIARLAGQYGKPRYAAMPNGGILVCLGSVDAVAAQTPDANRLLQAYFHSAATSNFIRHFSDEDTFWWQAGERLAPSRRTQLSALLKRARGESVHIVGQNREHRDGFSTEAPSLQSSLAKQAATSQEKAWGISRDIFISHEAILLPYESALTRESPGSRALAGSAHFLWVGDRTRQLDFAHVEFCRGIVNPIGVKVGPSAFPQEIVSVCRRLNPQNIPGKVSLITRLGYKEVESKLPALITAIRKAGIHVLWVCDPLHGNTKLDSNGVKRRVFEEILEELMKTVIVHVSNSSFLSGVHLELTGDEVLECSGGPKEDTFHPGSSDTGQGSGEPSNKKPLRLVTAFCDPRLNYPQAVELAFRLAETLKKHFGADGTNSSLQSESA